MRTGADIAHVDLTSHPAPTTTKSDATSRITGIISSVVQSACKLGESSMKIRDAEATSIGQEAQALSSTVLKLHKWLLTGAINPSAAASLNFALNTCLLNTTQLDKVIEPYTKTSRTRSMLTLKSLKATLNKQDVVELRQRWEKSKNTLAISLAMINRYLPCQQCSRFHSDNRKLCNSNRQRRTGITAEQNRSEFNIPTPTRTATPKRPSLGLYERAGGLVLIAICVCFCLLFYNYR